MRFTIRHETKYDFSEPVHLHRHRIMLRPRDSHDLRLIDARLTLSPPAPVIWSYDVFGNSIGEIDLDQEANSLLVSSEIEIERYVRAPSAARFSDLNTRWPVRYSPEDRRDLGALLHLDDEASGAAVSDWLTANGLTEGQGPVEILERLMTTIRNSFAYQSRYAEGTQSAAETLASSSGTCRDFAQFMMEAARTLGFGARFATGYLHNEGGTGDNLGAADTHAWTEVYIPEIGWTEYDPTNGLINDSDLIKVAAVRKPSQAVPVSGSFTGSPTTRSDLSVTVTVTRLDG